MPRGVHTAEGRTKVLEAAARGRLGRQVSAETRERIAARQSGEAGRNWAGELVGYGGAHKRHRAALPPYCEHCGTGEGQLDAALRHDAPAEHLRSCVRRRRVFSPFTEDYVRLCRTCHTAYDRVA